VLHLALLRGRCLRRSLYSPTQEYQPKTGRKILQPTRAYKICSAAEWAEAVRSGLYVGAPIDLSDGFIHLSTAEQVAETLKRHFAGQVGLVLIEIDLEKAGAALRWEPSRGGALFPHLYDRLSPSLATNVTALPDEAAARADFAAHLQTGAS
jgi:uncharacterized protein (DUF952 family)